MANEISLTYELNKNHFQTMPESQLAYLLIDIKPVQGNKTARAPLNLCLVIDRSASMKGQKIENVKLAIHHIINQMNETDFLSLVSFNEEAEVLVPGQPILDRDALKNLVNQLTPKNGTAISAGMKQGLVELRKNLTDNKINRMILLTDGQTYGDEDDCQQLAAEAASEGILITALGVGDEWYEEVLDTIAQKSNGTSDYIATPNAIIPIFADELKNLQSVFAQSAALTLRFSQNVSLRKICRALPAISELEYTTIADNCVLIDIGAIDVNQGQTLLAEVFLNLRQQGKYRIAHAELVYDIPANNLFQQKVRKDILVELSDSEILSKKINPRVMNVAERVSAYDLQTRAMQQAAVGDIAGATRKLRAAATRLVNLDEQELAETALEEALNLSKQGNMSLSGTKKLRYETRKLTRRLVA